MLRTARIDDAAEIARLAGELGYPTTVTEMATRLAVILPLQNHRVTVMESDGGKLLGWIAVERRHTLESGERIEIVGLVVDAATRRAGAGRTLVGDAEHWAKSQGFGTISVRSNITREASHPFYQRLGFERVKTQHVYRKAL